MFVYAIQVIAPEKAQRLVKIGQSTDPLRRLAQIQTSQAHRLEFVRLLPCKSSAHARHIEKCLHYEMRGYKIGKGGQEWFNYRVLRDIRRFAKRIGEGRKPGCVTFVNRGVSGHQQIMKYLDHIAPVAKGGGDNLDNLRFMCGPHNLQLGRAGRSDIRDP